MVATSWRFFGSGESAPHHHCIAAASQSFTDIATFAHTAVGDDRNVSASLLMIVIARGGAIDCRGHLRHAEAKNAATGASGPRSNTDQHASDSAAHQIEGDVIGHGIADDDGNLHGLSERAKLQRFILRRNMLYGGNGGLDDENVRACFLSNCAKALGLLGNGADGREDIGLL